MMPVMCQSVIWKACSLRGFLMPELPNEWWGSPLSGFGWLALAHLTESSAGITCPSSLATHGKADYSESLPPPVTTLNLLATPPLPWYSKRRATAHSQTHTPHHPLLTLDALDRPLLTPPSKPCHITTTTPPHTNSTPPDQASCSAAPGPGA